MQYKKALEQLVKTALAEDVGQGDITSKLTIPDTAQAVMQITAREPLVVCGLACIDEVFRQFSAPHPNPTPQGGMESKALSSPPPCGDLKSQEHAALDSRFRGNDKEESGNDKKKNLNHNVTIQLRVTDGDNVPAGTILAELTGNARVLLTGERVALNIMQRMSGVATLTRHYVQAVKGAKAKILDTRKTMPGMRALDKYAVRVGGGQNHRMRLDDMVLIKDNHLAVGLKAQGLGLEEVVKGVRAKLSLHKPQASSPIPIVVECDTLEQVTEALAVQPDRILLDNMSNDMLREAVALAAGRVPLEASGGVNLDTVRGIAETGVDYISVGALTHSARAVDIGADIKIEA